MSTFKIITTYYMKESLVSLWIRVRTFSSVDFGSDSTNGDPNNPFFNLVPWGHFRKFNSVRSYGELKGNRRCVWDLSDREGRMDRRVRVEVPTSHT